MKKTLFSLLAATACLSFAACSNNTTDSKEIAKEQNEQRIDNAPVSGNVADNMEDNAKFAVDAANNGMLEVRLGELAQKNAMNPQVKQFGKMMVDDHTKINNQLKEIASRKNIALPTVLSNDKQDMYNKLAGKTGASFDKDYMDQIVKDHENDVEMFRKVSLNATDPEMKNFAAQTLPTPERHLQRAREIQSMLK